MDETTRSRLVLPEKPKTPSQCGTSDPESPQPNPIVLIF